MSSPDKPKQPPEQPSEPEKPQGSAPRRVSNLRELGDLARRGQLAKLVFVHPDGRRVDLLPPVN